MPPAIILSVILGSIYGLLFFTALGSRRHSMWLMWIAGAAGFLGGQFLAEYVQFSSMMLGDVHLVEGTAVSLVALVIVVLTRTRRSSTT